MPPSFSKFSEVVFLRTIKKAQIKKKKAVVHVVFKSYFKEKNMTRKF